jgi:hypothetical protein
MLNVIYTECLYTECLYGECLYGECLYAECRYAKCRYAVSRGTALASLDDMGHRISCRVTQSTASADAVSIFTKKLDQCKCHVMCQSGLAFTKLLRLFLQ